MDIMNWPEKVNNEFNLEGDYGNEGGYVESLKFESGKERIHRKNTYIPLIYSVSLWLDNEIPVKDRNTEYKEFIHWFNVSVRHGMLPFYAPRIGYKKEWFIRVGEIGIYQFIPESLTFDTIDGIPLANFSVKELSFLPEIEYIFLTAKDGKILFTQNARNIVVRDGW